MARLAVTTCLIFLLIAWKTQCQSTPTTDTYTIIGPKGEKGERGRDGRHGFDGLPGPQGPPGSKGEPGKIVFGFDGLPGRQGLPGFPGARGTKGNKGDKGAFGIGLRGRDGWRGAQGPKGQKGTSHPVELPSQRPAAHLLSLSEGYIDESTWVTFSNRPNETFVQGGMIYYNNKFLTIPRNGLYYIYGQLSCYHTADNYCGLSISQNATIISFAFHGQSSPDSSWQSVSTNTVRMLQRGDILSLSTQGYGYYYISKKNNVRSFFGAVALT
ncbi:collagen alpha-2(I) chain-like [Corticium candelabrum]|uniref:collagen alpha-2(I) chain-like n=1 Tax=Corticium candelabrum TaxID=121492 RepID=UPI002E267E59|nr:collagen alpha-2(I) chain-like [Corticium candelabrum]